jgi:hypothetical protein
VALGVTTIRFDVAYCLALFLALDTCDSILLGGIPEGSPARQTLGWIAVAVVMIAPFALWRTRKSHAGRYLQDGFVILVIAGIVIAIFS